MRTPLLTGLALLFLASTAASPARYHGRNVARDRALLQQHGASPSTAPPTEAEIDKLVQQTLNRSNTPSASIAITRNGTVVWSKAYGHAHVPPHEAPATTDTLYWLASITKTTTAVLAMQLVEEGKLDLDRDVSLYLPYKIRNPHYPDMNITARMLMTHTSSIQDGGIWSDILSYVGGDPVQNLADATREYYTPGGLYNQAMNFHTYRPGSKWDYSNVGVATLGYICEVIAGMPYVELTTSRVLHPLGIKNAFWYWEDARKLGIPLWPQVAMPYSWKTVPTHPDVSTSDSPTKKKKEHIQAPQGRYGYPDIPAGMLKMSAGDLSRVASLLVCRGTLGNATLLRPSTVDVMLSNQSRIAPVFGSYNSTQGLIFYSSSEGTSATHDEQLWGHNGGDPGASTDSFFLRKGGVGVVVLTNSDGYGADAAIFEGLSTMEAKLFEFAWTLPEPHTPCAGAEK